MTHVNVVFVCVLYSAMTTRTMTKLRPAPVATSSASNAVAISRSKKPVAKVNTNMVDLTPRDLRQRFLAKENIYLMRAVARFSSNYVQGILSIADTHQMQRVDTRLTANLKKTAMCQGKCNKSFTRQTPSKFLFAVIDLNVKIEDPATRWSKYKLVCFNCSNEYNYTEEFACIELFPNLSLRNVERLCELGFITKFIFPIDLNYTTETVTTRVLNYHNFFEQVNEIVTAKSDKEQITSIRLHTYGRDLFVETIDNVSMNISIDATGKTVMKLQFGRESSMLQFVNTYSNQIMLTYFYAVTKRTYKTTYDYVVYFPIKCELVCKQCKDKVYKKINPILYCTRCGYTDSLFFTNSALLHKVNFDANCVKTVIQKAASIVYFDVSNYTKSLLNSKLMIK
jgi:hypothetical protein